ncbi:MAG: dihydroneopterin triphosphate diphosphatase [Gammaproteobacteria bacterium]|jgi:dATP pyrophosphohydrolase
MSAPSDPRRYKRPESVLVVVATAGGDVLLLRRREPPGFWQSVTGSLRWDEDPTQAARRELAEETGLVPAAGPEDTGRINHYPIIPPWTERYGPGTLENTEYVFFLCLDEQPIIRLNSEEHDDMLWLPAAEAANTASSATDRAAIREFAGSLG